MGVRRYSCFMFQVGVIAYILCVVFYLIGRNAHKPILASISDSLYSYKPNSLNNKVQPNPNYNSQPSSYVINPPQYPYSMKVDLPPPTNNTERQAAAFIVLVRNTELFGMIQSMNDVGMYILYLILV